MADAINTPDEEWRAIPGFDGYEASSIGRIRSVDRVNFYEAYGRTIQRILRGKIIVPQRAGSKLEYNYVPLGCDRRFKVGVHRLVALAFHGLPPTSVHQAAHINGDSTDNRADNISWKTPRENSHDRYLHGTMYGKAGMKGTKHHKAVLTDEQVLEIKASFTHRRGELTKIAMKYGVHISTIGRIRNGEGWSHI